MIVRGGAVLRAVLVVLAALLVLPALGHAQQPPDISAPSAIVMEASTGDVAFEKDPDGRRPIASTTKLMTALLTIEQGGLKDLVTAPRYRAAPAESLMIPRLTAGEALSVADLLRGLLMISANDAAVALAGHVGGSVPSFVRLMNRRAEELGLTNTSYANPIGLDDPENFSSARDLASLTRTLRGFAFFRRTVNATTATLTTGTPRPALQNRNLLLTREAWVDGVKTGNTSLAGDVLVASGRKRGVPLIAVVLGASTKDAAADEAVRLLNYAFPLYKRQMAIKRGARLTQRIPIEDRPGAELPIVAGEGVRQVIRAGQDFDYAAELPDDVKGPIERGERVGTLKISLEGRPVADVPLVADLEVPKAGFGRRTQDFLTRPGTLAVFGVVLLIAAALLSRRTRPTRTETPA